MRFDRIIASSDVLAHIIDIPEELKNKQVEITVLPYEYVDDQNDASKNARGIRAK